MMWRVLIIPRHRVSVVKENKLTMLLQRACIKKVLVKGHLTVFNSMNILKYAHNLVLRSLPASVIWLNGCVFLFLFQGPPGPEGPVGQDGMSGGRVSRNIR